MTLDVRRHRDIRRALKVRVFLNGRDVTSHCFYADGRRGVVRLYRINANGQKYVDDTGNAAATEELRGHVRWRRR